ncbi:MAG: hypothetical protein Q8N18_13745 [Opitutaceae bacterium]|nr:hypothetical protein [Opitutaceae bacterium]
MRWLFISAALLVALAGCARKETWLDGREIVSRTEKGIIKVIIPEGFKTDAPAASFDRIVEVARAELPRYTSDPASWELDNITRWHRIPPLFLTVTFTRGTGYEERILIPLSPDSRVLASPSDP